MQHGVARISLMDGQVSVRRGDAGEWVAGVINAPLLADDSISTAPNSRAEVQFDAANILRIGGNAEVHLTTLENNRYQMELARGTITFRVLRASSANVEVDTPSISVRPSKIGVYRISVNDSGETELTVRAGSVEVFSPKGSQWVNAGQTMRARGASSDPEFQMVAAIPADDWDRWSDSRDQTLMQASAAYQNVPPGVYGVEDMQNNGTWTDVPNYGQVWRPTVAAGWAPYSCGRWVWEDWYGWTWVSCDSWGWAPYHYGRWFFEANYGGWLWYPGVLGVRHYWSPALVGFFGWGGGVGFGFGFGNIGWVPLAPFEVFHPWWGRGFYGAGFAGRVNISQCKYLQYVPQRAGVERSIGSVRGEFPRRTVRQQYYACVGRTDPLSRAGARPDADRAFERQLALFGSCRGFYSQSGGRYQLLHTSAARRRATHGCDARVARGGAAGQGSRRNRAQPERRWNPIRNRPLWRSCGGASRAEWRQRRLEPLWNANRARRPVRSAR